MSAEEGTVVLRYVRIDEMVADILTKVLAKIKHEKFVKMLNILWEREIALRGSVARSTYFCSENA